MRRKIEATPEARAVARALAQKPARQLSQDEFDCLILYTGQTFVNGGLALDWNFLEGTAVFARGKQLRDAMPLVSEAAVNELEQLSAAQLAALTREHLQLFIEAWSRQIPGTECPHKIEGGRVYSKYGPPAWKRTGAVAAFGLRTEILDSAAFRFLQE